MGKVKSIYVSGKRKAVPKKKAVKKFTVKKKAAAPVKAPVTTVVQTLPDAAFTMMTTQVTQSFDAVGLRAAIHTLLPAGESFVIQVRLDPKDTLLVEMHQVNSTNVIAVGCDCASGRMLVLFKNRSLYLYLSVSVASYLELRYAPSVGSCLHTLKAGLPEPSRLF